MTSLAAPHAAWWARFWQRSSLTVPDLPVLQQYYLVRYFYGAASRRGAPPMPLQGVWSADAGSLPPWKGDYHNDLNTQMTYIAYRTSGDFDEGATASSITSGTACRPSASSRATSTMPLAPPCRA